MNFKIAGVVVLYNPEKDCIKNINSYLPQIDLLTAVDNSETPNSLIVDELKKNPRIEYVFNNRNLGIATALNQGARIALETGFDFLLTMDQDTFVDLKLIERYKKFLLENDFSDIGILAPVPVYTSEFNDEQQLGDKEKDVVITSGSLLNLKVLKKVGFFKDDLFIDYVDFEYCLRLRKNKYKIIQLDSAKVYHKLGNLEKHKVLFKNIYVTHHSPLRYYYRTRNRFYVDSRYLIAHPTFVFKDVLVFINELIKIFFFEKEKLLKLKMTSLGMIDFIRNKFGQF